MNVRNISIYRVMDSYALSVTRDDGSVIQINEWPEAQQGALNGILAFVDTLRSPAEQLADTVYQVAELAATDEQLLTMSEVIPVWKPGEEVAVSMARRYQDKVYRVIQAHITQADWTPDATPALWVNLNQSEAEGAEIIDWFEPTSTHFYSMGQLMRFTDGKVYKSLLETNTWSPVSYPAGWELQEGLV